MIKYTKKKIGEDKEISNFNMLTIDGILMILKANWVKINEFSWGIILTYSNEGELVYKIYKKYEEVGSIYNGEMMKKDKKEKVIRFLFNSWKKWCMLNDEKAYRCLMTDLKETLKH